MSWVDDVIAEGEAIVASFNAKAAAYYINRSLSLLSDCGVEKPKVGMQTQKQRFGTFGGSASYVSPGPDDEDYLEDVKTLVLRFKRIEADIESGEKGAGGTVVNIDNHNENVNSVTLTSSATAISSATYSEACRAVEELDSLDEEQKGELIDLLDGVRKAKGDEGLAKEAVKSLLDKAIGFGFDALKAVLPYVWGLLLALA